MGFLRIILWEYLQNLPILAGFVLGFDLWQGDREWAAVACLVAGALTGSILIALTEARKVAGHKEPLAVVIMNIIVMAVIMFALVVYLAAAWSGWPTDLAVGALGGAGLGIAQGLAAKKRVDLRHCAALSLSSALVLPGLHWFLDMGWPVWSRALSMTLLATLIISAIDYWPTEWRPARSSN